MIFFGSSSIPFLYRNEKLSLCMMNSNVNNIDIPDNVQALDIELHDKKMNINFPSNLEELDIWIDDNNKFSKLKLPATLEKLKISVPYQKDIHNLKLENIKRLTLLFNIEYIDSNSAINLNGLKLPKEMDELFIGIDHSEYRCMIIKDMDLDQLIRYKRDKLPKFIFQLYNGGLRNIKTYTSLGINVFQTLPKIFSYDELIKVSEVNSDSIYEIDYEAIKRNSNNKCEGKINIFSFYKLKTKCVLEKINKYIKEELSNNNKKH